MNRDEFRRLVFEEFGSDLRHATPANIRDFLNRLQQMQLPDNPSRQFVLNERSTTLESIMKDFFARVFDMPQEEAFILLWTLGFELAFGMVEDHAAAHFASLFQGMED